jgi:hypothetical protein
MALQSKFNLVKKLQDCALFDKDHIGEHTFPPENRKGGHVSLIHEALNAWAAKQNPPVKPVLASEVTDTRFGPDTARVVTLFKTQKNILNFKNQIDPIVGIKTIAALDLELAALTDPKPLVEKKVADIAIRFQGASSTGTLTPNNVVNNRRIVIYKAMPGQPFGDKVTLHPFNGRALIRVGRQTNTIGEASAGVFSSVLSELISTLVVIGMGPGKVFIHGSSSGGRNAIDFSAQLTRLGFNTHFVAAVDAATFQGDTQSRPEENIDRPRTIPDFNLDPGAVRNRHNFFQTTGNHAKRSLLNGVLFTSAMGGEEIHGTMAGFQNTDLTRFIPLNVTDDQAHSLCISRGAPEAERLIADDLLAA